MRLHAWSSARARGALNKMEIVGCDLRNGGRQGDRSRHEFGNSPALGYDSPSTNAFISYTHLDSKFWKPHVISLRQRPRGENS
jgi:hypothetical protein